VTKVVARSAALPVRPCIIENPSDIEAEKQEINVQTLVDRLCAEEEKSTIRVIRQEIAEDDHKIKYTLYSNFRFTTK
jgi:hypothetical protein